MNEEFILHISKTLNTPIESINSVSGGDISSAYKISTAKQHYFLKTNSNLNALSMFKSEAKALKTIGKTGAIATPTVVAYSQFKNTSYLLLEYIETKQPTAQDLKMFGEQLANLHQNSNTYFGFNDHNFIGNLNQSNKITNSWHTFYVNERLAPQLKMAVNKHLLLESDCPLEEQMLESLFPFFENIKPSLLHGDLWSGNYIISENSIPYLIDPAMYFGHSEVDIAMTKLFGGFSEGFYKAYHNIIPPDNFTSKRIEIYQLYYLLIHLNIFGKSYYSSVIHLLKKHF